MSKTIKFKTKKIKKNTCKNVKTYMSSDDKFIRADKDVKAIIDIKAIKHNIDFLKKKKWN